MNHSLDKSFFSRRNPPKMDKLILKGVAAKKRIVEK